MKLSLATKFNLVFLFIFTVGYLAIGILGEHMREESVRFWLESALSTRLHTSTESSSLPNTSRQHEFRSGSEPPYAAGDNVNLPIQEFDNSNPPRSALNPNDLESRASNGEEGQMKELRSDARLNEVVGNRERATRPSFGIAYPQIGNQISPTWHTTATIAPNPMTDIYSGNDRFGSKLNATVSAQIISVPIEVPLKRADMLFKTAMLFVLIVFAIAFVSLNVMVYYFVTRRIGKLSRLADEVSMGKFDGDDFDVRGRDEVSNLAQSFRRMRTSLARALKMLEETN